MLNTKVIGNNNSSLNTQRQSKPVKSEDLFAPYCAKPGTVRSNVKTHKHEAYYRIGKSYHIIDTARKRKLLFPSNKLMITDDEARLFPGIAKKLELQNIRRLFQDLELFLTGSPE